MQRAIYLKVENEACFCQTTIKDGTKCVIHRMKTTEEFVKVNGYSKGHFGCLVYYRAKNFIITSEVDETEMERKLQKETV